MKGGKLSSRLNLLAKVALNAANIILRESQVQNQTASSKVAYRIKEPSEKNGFRKKNNAKERKTMTEKKNNARRAHP